MRPFHLAPKAATLEGMIHGQSAREMPLRLEHVIRVELPDAELTVAGLDLGVRSFRALGGRGYSFSTRPRQRQADGEVYEEYEVEGALELPSGLERVVIERLEFGVLDQLTLGCSLALESHISGAPRERAQLSFALSIGPIEVFGDRGHPPPSSRDQAEAMAARFVDLADYRLSLDGKRPALWPLIPSSGTS